jgi:hypothetical protein
MPELENQTGGQKHVGANQGALATLLLRTAVGLLSCILALMAGCVSTVERSSPQGTGNVYFADDQTPVQGNRIIPPDARFVLTVSTFVQYVGADGMFYFADDQTPLQGKRFVPPDARFVLTVSNVVQYVGADGKFYFADDQTPLQGKRFVPPDARFVLTVSNVVQYVGADGKFYFADDQMPLQQAFCSPGRKVRTNGKQRCSVCRRGRKVLLC